jgi:hypothetical protein
MKILGVGLSRTGTTSLYKALQILGFNSLHWEPERLREVLDGSNPAPNFRYYDDVDAVTDLPAAYFYDELLEAYPGCQCILTIRDENAWWKSIEAHFNKNYPVKSLEDDFLRWQERNYVYGSATAYEFLYRKKYREHNERVIQKIPAQQLLLMNITEGDGWEKLCPFLGVEIPPIAFPHTNKRDVNWKFAATDITECVGIDEKFILVSDGWLGKDVLPDRKALPFLERDGQYWGSPADSETAIIELERLRQEGANFIIFLWTSFWWLDYYDQFERYLFEQYDCILQNDRCIIFDLK